MRTGIDRLVIGNCVMRKRAQPAAPQDERWKQEFALD
jgi:hypothetical protein